jgi:hypothetical protein
MGIEPRCGKCKKELKEFGAILLSPPKVTTQLRNFTYVGLAMTK